MTRVGIVGCGAIGTALAQALERRYGSQAVIVGVSDLDQAQAQRLQRKLRSHPPILSLTTLIRRSQLIIEAASVRVAGTVARLALAADRDALIMSTGGLLSGRWRSLARRSKGRLIIPSGALCGVDGIKAMAVGAIRRMSLTTRKPPQALASAPGAAAARKRLASCRSPVLLFRGTPRDVVAAFPQNTNVAATMVLSAGWQRPHRASRRIPMTVNVVADPSLRQNVHELDVEGDCGRLTIRIQSRPSSRNPKTSELAIRSAIASLGQLFETVRVGT
jgi:aspartate dehydrogenase